MRDSHAPPGRYHTHLAMVNLARTVTPDQHVVDPPAPPGDGPSWEPSEQASSWREEDLPAAGHPGISLSHLTHVITKATPTSYNARQLGGNDPMYTHDQFHSESVNTKTKQQPPYSSARRLSNHIYFTNLFLKH